jgi:hypothetical protein
MSEFKLDSEPKIKAGFSIPENYFDTFPDALKSQLPKNESMVISIFRNRKRQLQSIAAVLVIGLLVSVFYKFNNQDSEIGVSELENYITNQSSINQYDLMSSLAAEDIESLKNEKDLDQYFLDDLELTSSELEQMAIE